METSGPTSGIPQLLNSLATRATALQLQVGQQLQAVVVDNSAGRILLSLGHRQVSAESSLPFERGQALTLQVRSLGAQPVLKVISALQESPTTMAIRLLLPRHGPTTPLLANLAALAKNPDAPVPPLVREAARTLVAELPSSRQLASAAGLKDAIARSGLLLEHKLTRAAPGSDRPALPLAPSTDFKANLVRLVQLVRQWPGGNPQPAAQSPAISGSPAASPGAGTPAAAAQTAAITPTSQPPSPPQSPLPGTGTPPPAAAPPDLRPTAPGAPPAPTPNPAQTSPTPSATPPAVTPDQARSAIQSPGTPLPARPAAVTGAQPAQTVSTPAAGTGLTAPPPLPGVIPLPQAAVKANLELVNRIGNLRPDLLQQAEAALARVQLSQLASLPREAERGLVEWLFDIPVRRNDEIDFWSARFLREGRDQADSQEDTANWTVQLAFDLPGLGPMQAQIQLHGERVSTHFWASQADTLPLLREHLPELRQSLDEVGLEVGAIDCQPGEIPDSGKPQANPLIREKA